MPHKFNAFRRDKIPKQKHRVTNWAEYVDFHAEVSRASR